MKNKKQASIIFMLLTSVALVLGSCRKEKIQPEQANSFIKYYGKGGAQKAGNVALTPDGGYILVGTSDSYGDGKQIIVIKTDKFGNEAWNKILGGAGDDEGNWVIVSSNGNYILTGYKAESAGGTTDVYVAELTASGDLVGENTYGKAGKNDYGIRIINTFDQHYGYAIVGSSNDFNNVYLVKIDKNRDTSWTAQYGNTNKNNIGSGICQLADSSYITSAFYTNTAVSTDKNIILTSGRLQRNNIYNPYSNIDNQTINSNIVDAKDILLDNTGNTFILGTTNNNDIYIANVSSGGWYHSISSSSQDMVSSFVRTTDGGFIIVGSSLNDGNWDVLVVRADANSNPIWTKTFGGTGNDYGASVVQIKDGSFVIAATISFGGNATGSNDVISLIHIDSNGELK